MSCNCKTNSKSGERIGNNENLNFQPSNVLHKIGGNKYFLYSFRFILYLLSIVSLFVVLPYILYILFRSIVLSKDNNIMDIIKKVIPNKNKWSPNDDEYDEEDEDDEDFENEFGEHYDDLVDNNGNKIIELSNFEEEKTPLKK